LDLSPDLSVDGDFTTPGSLKLHFEVHEDLDWEEKVDSKKNMDSILI